MAQANCMPDTKATNTHSQYVIIIIAFPLHQRLHENASLYDVRTLPFLFSFYPRAFCVVTNPTIEPTQCGELPPSIPESDTPDVPLAVTVGAISQSSAEGRLPIVLDGVIEEKNTFVKCVTPVVLGQYKVPYILCIYLHIHTVKTQQSIRQQQYVIYNYMFRPCKWAIIRLFIELLLR